MSRRFLLSGCLLSLGCLEHSLVQVEMNPESEASEAIPINVNRDVDILFVIDNSRSMGEEQLNLSRNFGHLLTILEEPDVAANYRVGITTTDSGHPDRSCEGTTPEGGHLVLSSCRSRTDEFVSDFGSDDLLDQTASCTDFCPEVFEALGVLPSTAPGDPTARPRPWIENVRGMTNLPEGVTPTQALQCFGPQGVRGCGFESHLESMRRALLLSSDRSEREFGFIRPAALLAVVFVTDEADCSYDPAQQSVFDPRGDRALWSEGDEYPRSSICWRAGTQCTAEGCTAANVGVDGVPLSGPSSQDRAVLYPVDRYIELLQGIETTKSAYRDNQSVLVAAISGVPQGYAGGDVPYSSAPGGSPNNPTFEQDFGIGPGCTSSVAEAVPPVRLRSFAEFFALENADGTHENNLFSVCDEDYGPALEQIAKSIQRQIRPPCMRGCVADTDPITAGLDPTCTLTETVTFEDGTSAIRDIPECDGDQVPEGAASCHRYVTGEDMSEACQETSNLEFALVERPVPGEPPRITSHVQATCQLSQSESIDCPDIE